MAAIVACNASILWIPRRSSRVGNRFYGGMGGAVSSERGTEADIRRGVCRCASGRPDRRGRKNLPYIRRMSREKQREKDAAANREESWDSGAREAEEKQTNERGSVGKLPIESNGPPLLILYPFISPQPVVDESSLRALPLPVPHKLRPLRLPKPALRRRLGALPFKRAIGNANGDDFLRTLAADIRDLPEESGGGGGEGVSELLDRWAWKLNKGALSKTVRELGALQASAKVLQVLLWLQEQPHLWPDETTLSAMIHVMVEAGEIEIACKLQRTVGRDSAKAAQTLASALATAGMLKEAVQLVNRMKHSGWRVDASVHTKLTVWACRTGARDLADRLWTNVDLSDLRLTLHDYTTIMSSCSKLGLHDKLEHVYEHFRASGLQPNIVMYTALISARSREGRYREAIALFWDMEEAGCSPDLLAYEVMLDVCAKLGDLQKAVKVHKDLKNAGYSPTPCFYNTLIQLFVNNGLMSRASELVREMSSRGLAPSAQTMSILSARSPSA